MWSSARHQVAVAYVFGSGMPSMLDEAVAALVLAERREDCDAEWEEPCSSPRLIAERSWRARWCDSRTRWWPSSASSSDIALPHHQPILPIFRIRPKDINSYMYYQSRNRVFIVDPTGTS